MRPGGQRAKGHTFEREVARDLRAIFGESVKRGLQSRGGGSEEADVECPIFHIECKRGKKPNPRAALKQAIEDSAPRGKMPVAIIRDDRQEAFVVMRYGDWMKLLSVAK